jgi:hypothetical protein
MFDPRNEAGAFGPQLLGHAFRGGPGESCGDCGRHFADHVDPPSPAMRGLEARWLQATMRAKTAERERDEARGHAKESTGSVALMERQLADVRGDLDKVLKANERIAAERDEQRARAEVAQEYAESAQRERDEVRALLKEALGAPGDPDFILWTANRFVNVYKESPHVAHVEALRQRAGVVLAVLARAKAAGYEP